jgi:hypothetical protein
VSVRVDQSETVEVKKKCVDLKISLSWSSRVDVTNGRYLGFAFLATNMYTEVPILACFFLKSIPFLSPTCILLSSSIVLLAHKSLSFDFFDLFSSFLLRKERIHIERIQELHLRIFIIIIFKVAHKLRAAKQQGNSSSTDQHVCPRLYKAQYNQVYNQQILWEVGQIGQVHKQISGL